VCDCSVFVGNFEDVVDTSFGFGLLFICEWMWENFDFVGYVMGFDLVVVVDFEVIDVLCAQFGVGLDEWFCLVMVGGLGVGVLLF